jgi:chemotaxis protein histidine kinase CheA
MSAEAETSFVARQLAVSRARREMLEGTARRAWAPNGPPPSTAPPPSPPARDLWLLNAGGGAAASELHEAQRKLDAVLEANVVAEAKCGELRHALAQQTQELETRAATAAAREQEYLATIASLEASLITERAATAAVEQLADAAAEEAAAAHAASEAQLRKQGERLDAELRLALRRIAESDEATAAARAAQEAAEERALAAEERALAAEERAEERALAAEEAAEERVRLVLAERVRWSASLLDASREADAQANARVADAVAEAAAASGAAPVSVRAAPPGRVAAIHIHTRPPRMVGAGTPTDEDEIADETRDGRDGIGGVNVNGIGGDSGGDSGASGVGVGVVGVGGVGVGRWLTEQLESMEAHRRDLADLAQSLAAQQAALETARGAGKSGKNNYVGT